VIGKAFNVKSFRNELAFLSNFYASPLVYEGQHYPSAEHAYQCAKTRDPSFVQQIRHAESPVEAKRLGRIAPMRPDWEAVKLDVMEAVLRAKFEDPALAFKLAATGELPLEEKNSWGDRFWGTTNGVGRNHFGRLLEKIRPDVRACVLAREAAQEKARVAEVERLRAEQEGLRKAIEETPPTQLREGQVVTTGENSWRLSNVERLSAKIEVLSVSEPYFSRYLDVGKVYTLKRIPRNSDDETWEVEPSEMKRQISQILLYIGGVGDEPTIDLDS
jgi:hypothetical protein